MVATSVKERVRKWREKQKQRGGKSISIVLNAESSIQLEKIRKQSNLTTISDVVNQSLSLYKLLLEKEEQGFEVWVIPDKNLTTEMGAVQVSLSNDL